MAISLNINGQTYLYPEVGDVAWGPDATDWAVAVTGGMLQKAGGLFQLLAETDFGSAYGIKSLYLKSRTTNPAASGQIRLARADTISWRNEANDADLALTINASDDLEYDSKIILTDSSSIDATQIADGSVNNTEFEKLGTAGTNADGELVVTNASQLLKNKSVVDNTFAVVDATNATTKMEFFANGDPNTSAQIVGLQTATRVYSLPDASMTFVGDTTAQILTNKTIVAANNSISGITNTNISAAAAIAYSKLALTGSIVDADINASAAIAGTKISPAFGSQIVSTTASFLGTEISTPASPSSGTRKLYPKSDGWYGLDSAGNETPLGGTVASLSSPTDNKNYSITATVAANALTITLKTKAGATPDSNSPVVIGFRNPTAATGDYETVSVVAATTIVVPSTATLGQVSGATEQIYVYLLNNSGTGELVVTTTPINEQVAQTSTTISTGATSRTGIYSTTGRTSKAVRLLGVVQSTQTTAGTWAASPSQISIGNLPVLPTAQSNSVATALGQKFYLHGTTYNNGIAPTTAATNFTVVRALYIPYQMQDGTWRLRFNIYGTATGTRTQLNLTVNGVAFKTSAIQSFAGLINSSSIFPQCYAPGGNNELHWDHSSLASNYYVGAGDMELDSKPTWAY